MKKTLNIVMVLKDSWKLFLEHKHFYLKVVLVFGLIAVVADWLREEDSMMFIDVVLSIINMVATWYGSIVLMKASLSVVEHKPIASDVYNLTISTIITLVLASVLTGLGVFVGVLLFIIPGILFALRTSLTQYLILDEQLSSVSAIKRSIALTKGYSWSLFRLALCFIVGTALSIFPLFGLGFIVLIPISTIALSLVYHKIKAEQNIVPQA